jgi:phosphoserine phosphatase
VNPLPMPAQEFAPGLLIQHITPPLSLSAFKAIAFDMDSTLISIECIDEIADAVGKKAEVAAITEAAMRGEITDFKDSLRRRVALLKGVPAEALQEVYDQRLKINPGAPELINAAKAAGLHTLLVSGGFTFFADRVRDRLGMHEAHSNTLEIEGGAHSAHRDHQDRRIVITVIGHRDHVSERSDEQSRQEWA